MARNILTLVVVLILSAGTALAGSNQSGLQLFNDVAGAVRSYPNFTIFDDVRVDVDNGAVTLSGRVTMPHKRAAIEARVARVAGVQSVQNGLKVLPVSNYDAALRYRVAQAIYGDPRFYHYASMANPPIHIIVENGRVTLTGVVNSEVERVLARSLATGVGELSVASELRTDSEARADREAIR